MSNSQFILFLVLLIIDENIRFNSWASFHKYWASAPRDGHAAIIIFIQCFVSLDSFRHKLILWTKSFF